MNRFIESRIFHILCTLTDLVVLNLLYVLCCIPVVTIGAATRTPSSAPTGQATPSSGIG